MAKFQKDQRVTFTRQHDRSHSLTGAVVEVKDEEVLVAADPDGVPVWTLASHVSALPEEPKKAEKAHHKADSK